MSLFHDRKVGGEVGVKYLVESQPAQRGDHFAGDDFAGRQPQRFAEGDARRGSSLDDRIFLGIGEGGEYLFGVVALTDGGRRADRGALSAVGAGDLVESEPKGRFDDGLEATVHEGIDVKALTLVAGSDAAAAEDALIGVAHKARVALIFFSGARSAGIGHFADAEVSGRLLKFAVLVLLAEEAVLRMVRKKELDDRFAGLAYLRSVRIYYHTVRYGIDTGCAESAAADYLNYTDAAGALFGKLRVIAELRNADSGFGSGFDHGKIGWHLYCYAVYSNLNKFHILFTPLPLAEISRARSL